MTKLNLTVEFMLNYINKPCVYLWLRGNDCLYVGVSNSILARIFYHNIIGKREAIRPDDVINIIVCGDMHTAELLEQTMIEHHIPKYNIQKLPLGLKRQRLGKFPKVVKRSKRASKL